MRYKNKNDIIHEAVSNMELEGFVVDQDTIETSKRILEGKTTASQSIQEYIDKLNEQKAV